MSIKVYENTYDNVIKSKFIIASTSYDYSINTLVNLIDKLSIQRRFLDTKIYKRLEKDLKKGCIMPPITVAFISNEDFNRFDNDQLETYINDNIQSAFILDGIQRLSTLHRIYTDIPESIKNNSFIVLNILICPSMDNLLYRMITLNNGQRPMTPKHQIEILTANDPLFNDIEKKLLVSTEKEGYSKNTFNKADIIKSYLAFISNSTNIDNNKIIESKLEELIAENIIESFEEKEIDFSQVINLISSFIDPKNDYDDYLLKWFRVSNNLIGFCVGIKKSYNIINEESLEGFKENLYKLDHIMSAFNPSKIKIGTMRRNVVKEFIENYEQIKEFDLNEILEFILAKV